MSRLVADSPHIAINRYNLRDLRHRARLTQRGLADKAGINATYLSHLETGRRAHVSPAVYGALIDALGCDWDALRELAAGDLP